MKINANKIYTENEYQQIYIRILFSSHIYVFCSYREAEREDYAVWLRDKFMIES